MLFFISDTLPAAATLRRGAPGHAAYYILCPPSLMPPFGYCRYDAAIIFVTPPPLLAAMS